MLREISAGGVLFHDDQILILRKPNGEWIMPKGHVEHGETIEQAAVREVKEETGLDARIVARVGQTHYRFRRPQTGELRAKTVYWFVMETRQKEVHLEPTFVECDFIGVDKALDTLTFTEDKEIVRKALDARRQARR